MNFTVGKYGCELWCLLENKCVSVNIGSGKSPSSVICELSDSDHCQHPKDLKPRQGWTYRGAKVSHVKLKRLGQISPLLSITEVVWVLLCFCSQAKSQFYLSFYFPQKVIRLWDVKLITLTNSAAKRGNDMANPIKRFFGILIYYGVGKWLREGKPKSKTINISATEKFEPRNFVLWTEFDILWLSYLIRILAVTIHAPRMESVFWDTLRRTMPVSVHRDLQEKSAKTVRTGKCHHLFWLLSWERTTFKCGSY